MVRLYLCQACQNNNHKKCELGHSVPKGQFGGSLCKCGCRGNPKWNDPYLIHEELSKQLRQLTEFETKSKNNLVKKRGNPDAN